MTDREKAIVMAYTGVCMLAGDKLSVFYEYVESIMGRPVYTHEMGTKVVDNLIKEKARPDFIALCADESCSEKLNKSEIPTGWIPCEKRLPDKLQDVLITFYDADGEYDVAFMRKTFNETYKAQGSEYEWVSSMGETIYADYEVSAWMPIEPYKASPTGAESEVQDADSD